MLTVSWGRKASQTRYKTRDGREQMGVYRNIAFLVVRLKVPRHFVGCLCDGVLCSEIGQEVGNQNAKKLSQP